MWKWVAQRCKEAFLKISAEKNGRLKNTGVVVTTPPSVVRGLTEVNAPHQQHADKYVYDRLSPWRHLLADTLAKVSHRCVSLLSESSVWTPLFSRVVIASRISQSTTAIGQYARLQDIISKSKRSHFTVERIQQVIWPKASWICWILRMQCDVAQVRLKVVWHVETYRRTQNIIWKNCVLESVSQLQ